MSERSGFVIWIGVLAAIATITGFGVNTWKDSRAKREKAQEVERARTEKAREIVERAFNSVSRGLPTLPETKWLPIGKERETVEQALTDVQTAVAMDPKSGQGHNVLGILFARLGRYDDALGEFALALSWIGADTSWRALILSNIGGVYLERCDFVQAEKNLSASLQTRDTAMTRAALADCLLRQGHLVQAEQQAEAAVKADVKQKRMLVSAHFVYGKVLRLLKKHDEAIKELKVARDIDPQYLPDVHVTLSKAYNDIGDRPAALNEAAGALDVAPSFAEAHEWYAALLDQAGQAVAAGVERKRAQDLMVFRKPNADCQSLPQ